MKQRLIIFTRFPRIGITKTRLIPALCPGGAAEIQRTMTEYTVSIARNASGERDIEVRFDGCTAREMCGWLGDGMTYVPQGRVGNTLFRSIAWGTGTVFSDTRAIAETYGLRVRVLEMLSDIDRPEDLDVWYRVRGAGRGIARRKSRRE